MASWFRQAGEVVLAAEDAKRFGSVAAAGLAVRKRESSLGRKASGFDSAESVWMIFWLQTSCNLLECQS